MEHDSGALAEFYRSALGHVARKLILHRLREIWPDVKGQRLLGFGFAAPYLRSLSSKTERTVAMVPEQLGSVTAWPGPTSHTITSDGVALPFADAMFDRVLVVHGLESVDALRPMMRQLWRVMAPDAKLLLVAPNRTSLWALAEHSPFAHGKPFTRGQLETLMRESLFATETWETALLIPPFRSRRLIGSGNSWEAFGRRLWPALAGVHIVEATKALYAQPPHIAVAQRAHRLATVEK